MYSLKTTKQILIIRPVPSSLFFSFPNLPLYPSGNYGRIEIRMFIYQKDCSQGTTCFSIPLEKRKILKKAFLKRTNLFILAFVFALIKIFIEDLSRRSSLKPGDVSFFLGFFSVGIIIIFIILISGFIYEIYYFQNYFYDIMEDGITIRKGWISRKEITIYFNRVQNVFVDQDFFDRILKLYDVHVGTADIQSILIAHIDGVSEVSAQKLKEILLKKIKNDYPESKQAGL